MEHQVNQPASQAADKLLGHTIVFMIRLMLLIQMKAMKQKMNYRGFELCRIINWLFTHKFEYDFFLFLCSRKSTYRQHHHHRIPSLVIANRTVCNEWNESKEKIIIIMNSIFDRRNNTFGWTVVIMYIHDYAHFLSHTQFHLKVYVFVSAHNAVIAICADCWGWLS